MSLIDKESAFQNLVNETGQQSANIASTDRLTGDFAQAIFQALQAELRHEEMIAALTIGHFFDRKASNISPKYSFLFAPLDFWETVYLEAEEYWTRQYRGEDE